MALLDDNSYDYTPTWKHYLPLEDKKACLWHVAFCWAIFGLMWVVYLMNYHRDLNMFFILILVGELSYFWFYLKLFTKYLNACLVAVFSLFIFLIIVMYFWVYLGLLSPDSIFYLRWDHNSNMLFILLTVEITFYALLYIAFSFLPFVMKQIRLRHFSKL